MYKFFVQGNQIENNIIIINNDDVNHIKNVLRLSIGEKIEISNSDTAERFECEISELQKK